MRGSPPEDTDWMQQSVCVDHDPDLWTETTIKRGVIPWHTPDNQMAKALCRHCPVRRACLAHVTAFETATAMTGWGIYAAMTPDERATLYGMTVPLAG